MKDEDKGQYKIAVKARIVKGLISRNQFDLLSIHRLLTETDVNPENSVSLRTAGDYRWSFRLLAKDLLNVTALEKRSVRQIDANALERS